MLFYEKNVRLQRYSSIWLKDDWVALISPQALPRLLRSGVPRPAHATRAKLKPSVGRSLTATRYDMTASQSSLSQIDEYLCNPTFFYRKTIINNVFFSPFYQHREILHLKSLKLDILIDVFLSFIFLDWQKRHLQCARALVSRATRLQLQPACWQNYKTLKACVYWAIGHWHPHFLSPKMQKLTF